MIRLYCSLNLDKHHIQRFNQQITVLQKDAVDRIFREMLRRNEKIQGEMNSHARRFEKRQENGNVKSQENYSEELGTMVIQGTMTTGDMKILREARRNINLMETPTKLTINPGSHLKQKTLSNQRRINPDTLYNNWLPRRDSKKR